MVAAAVGGINITRTAEGLERYPVNLRFPRERRNDLVKLRELPLVTPTNAQVPLGQVATVEVVDGAPMLKSENARLNGRTFVDIRGVDVGTYVRQSQAAVRDRVRLPPPATPLPGPASTSTSPGPGAARPGDPLHPRHHLQPALSHLPPCR